MYYGELSLKTILLGFILVLWGCAADFPWTKPKYRKRAEIYLNEKYAEKIVIDEVDLGNMWNPVSVSVYPEGNPESPFRVSFQKNHIHGTPSDNRFELKWYREVSNRIWDDVSEMTVGGGSTVGVGNTLVKRPFSLSVGNPVYDKYRKNVKSVPGYDEVKEFLKENMEISVRLGSYFEGKTVDYDKVLRLISIIREKGILLDELRIEFKSSGVEMLYNGGPGGHSDYMYNHFFLFPMAYENLKIIKRAEDLEPFHRNYVAYGYGKWQKQMKADIESAGKEIFGMSIQARVEFYPKDNIGKYGVDETKFRKSPGYKNWKKIRRDVLSRVNIQVCVPEVFDNKPASYEKIQKLLSHTVSGNINPTWIGIEYGLPDKGFGISFGIEMKSSGSRFLKINDLKEKMIRSKSALFSRKYYSKAPLILRAREIRHYRSGSRHTLYKMNIIRELKNTGGYKFREGMFFLEIWHGEFKRLPDKLVTLYLTPAETHERGKWKLLTYTKG